MIFSFTLFLQYRHKKFNSWQSILACSLTILKLVASEAPGQEEQYSKKKGFASHFKNELYYKGTLGI